MGHGGFFKLGGCVCGVAGGNECGADAGGTFNGLHLHDSDRSLGDPRRHGEFRGSEADGVEQYGSRQSGADGRWPDDVGGRWLEQVGGFDGQRSGRRDAEIHGGDLTGQWNAVGDSSECGLYPQVRFHRIGWFHVQGERWVAGFRVGYRGDHGDWRDRESGANGRCTECESGDRRDQVIDPHRPGSGRRCDQIHGGHSACEWNTGGHRAQFELHGEARLHRFRLIHIQSERRIPRLSRGDGLHLRDPDGWSDRFEQSWIRAGE